MPKLISFVATIVTLAFAQASANQLAPVPRGMLCVTEGELSDAPDHSLSVRDPKMRAYVNAPTPPEAELRFTYQGPTDKDIPLGSGEMRRQFGLKLLAEDACNLLYVMWRFEPASKIVVSVKSNPGQHTSAECGNRGYTNLKPSRASKSVPAIPPGSSHQLQAILHGQELNVFADGSPAWEGSIPSDASLLKGPVGVRSDNAGLSFTLLTITRALNPNEPASACRNDSGE